MPTAIRVSSVPTRRPTRGTPGEGLVVRDSKRHDSWRLPHGNRFYRWRLDPMPNGFTAVEYLDKSGWHRWHIPDGRKTFKTDAEFHAPGHLRLLVPGGRDVVGRDYRGTLGLVKPSSTSNSRETVNVLSLDAYVKGVVPYEMPASWRQQALRARRWRRAPTRPGSVHRTRTVATRSATPRRARSTAGSRPSSIRATAPSMRRPGRC